MEYAEATSQTPPTVTYEMSGDQLKQLGAPALVELTAFISIANFYTRTVAFGIESQRLAAACGLRPLAEPSTTTRSATSRGWCHHSNPTTGPVIAVSVLPSAHVSTIRDLSASACEEEWRRAPASQRFSLVLAQFDRDCRPSRTSPSPAPSVEALADSEPGSAYEIPESPMLLGGTA